MASNQEIIAALASSVATCRYSKGQGLLLAVEGEILSAIPAGVYVHRVPVGAAKDYSHMTQGVPGYLTRYFCRQFSIGAQADMRASGVDPVLLHRSICNVDASALVEATA